MGEYITEYVSSGRNRNDYTPFDGIQKPTVGSIANVLDGLGIKGFSFDKNPDDPPVKPREIVYFYGPCETMGATHWIAVFNNLRHSGTEWTQELCIWVKDDKWRLTTVGEDPIVGYGMEKCMRLLDEMVNNPTKKIEI